MAVDQRGLRALAHSVRIRRALDANPNHGVRGEFEQSRKIYYLTWAVLSPAQRQEVIEAALGIPDMTPEAIAAEVAALEA